jgi:nucleoside-diphosphate-sugar epimerase
MGLPRRCTQRILATNTDFGLTILHSDNTSILITGATGFIGHPLVHQLAAAGFRVRAAMRNLNQSRRFDSAIELCSVGNINSKTPWHKAVRNVGVVVHLASGVDQSDARNISLLEQYRAVNVAGTQALIAAAATDGVKRFVYVSTIKVNGEQTAIDAPYIETDRPCPEDAYAQSKWEAEQLLHEQCKVHGLMLTILRPPIVYGPGVKGNFLALMKALQRGVPLPLGSIENRRSMIYLGNLLDAIKACINSQAPVGNTYLVSDGEDLSTPGLIRQVAAALGVRPRLLPCPPALLALGANLLGRAETWRRLGGSLQVDSSKICRKLGWHPPFSVVQGLEETGRWYLKAVSGER